jgi:hypothetical protein
MGTWGEGAFDNDEAADWAFELEDVDDLSLVESTLADYEREPDMYTQCAVAACEVVARLRGNMGDDGSDTEQVDQWVAAHPIEPSPALVDRCTSAIDRIVASSTLGQNFRAIPGGRAWFENMRDLRARVAG